MTTHDAVTDNPFHGNTWIPCQDSVYDDVMDSHDSLDFIGLLETLGFMAARYAHKQGFHDAQYVHSTDTTTAMLSVCTRIALLHSEASEMLEAVRKPTTSNVIAPHSQLEEEAADLLIRLLDLAGTHRLRLAEATLAKMAYNKTREPMHGKKV